MPPTIICGGMNSAVKIYEKKTNERDRYEQGKFQDRPDDVFNVVGHDGIVHHLGEWPFFECRRTVYGAKGIP